MSEDIKDEPIPEVEFIRFRYAYEDLAGYVTVNGDKIIIQYPLIVELDTIYEEGRQALYMKEFLPQQIISETTVEFPLDEILFHLPVRDAFVDHYEQAKEYFFFEQVKGEVSLKRRERVATEEYIDEETQEKVENVISIIDALRDKKDKPVH